MLMIAFRNFRSEIRLDYNMNQKEKNKEGTRVAWSDASQYDLRV